MPIDTKPKPFEAKVDRETLKVLMDNIHNLYHPLGWIKHPYFQPRMFATSDGMKTEAHPGQEEANKRFCEALLLLLDKHGKLKKPKVAAK